MPMKAKKFSIDLNFVLAVATLFFLTLSNLLITGQA